MQPSSLLLASFILLQVGIYLNFGFYTPLALFLVFSSFVVLLVALAFNLYQAKRKQLNKGLLVGGVLLFLFTSSIKLPGLYVHSTLYSIMFFYAMILVGLLIILFYALQNSWKDQIRSWVFVTIVFIAFALRITMPLASPSPIIDVFVILQESSRNLLHGLNPYSIPITDVYGRTEHWNKGYPYFPGSLYLVALGYLITGDVRYTYVAAEALIVVASWKFMKRRMNLANAELLVLLFLFSPKALFILEQAWVEPLILSCMALFLFFQTQGKSMAAAMTYGYLLSLKQYLLYFPLLWLLVERRMRFVIAGLCVTLAIFLPFILLDPLTLLQRLMDAFYAAPPPGSLSIATPLSIFLGVNIPKGMSLATGGLVAVSSFFVRRKSSDITIFLYSSTITTFAMFLFGPQANANYYYFVGGFLFFLLVFEANQVNPQNLSE